MLQGDFRTYQGEWTIVAEGDLVTVTFSAELDWGAYNMSRFFGQTFEKRAERTFRGMLLSFEREVSRRSRQSNCAALPRFGYISNLLSQHLTANGYGDKDIDKKRPELFEETLKWLPPFRRGIVTGVKSSLGTEVMGDMILLNLLPKQMLIEDDALVLGRLLEAGRMAVRFGDKILGLGSYAANVGRKGVHLAKHLPIPVTTGSSYTIAVVIEAIHEACRTIGLALADASIAIVGATGTIGSICAHMLAVDAGRLVLVARNQHRLETLSGDLLERYGTEVTCTIDLNSAITNADIVITATNTPGALIDVHKLKPGTIVYDVSQPPNVSEKDAQSRPDVLVLDGGVVKPPGPVDFHFSFGLAPGLAYACIAEVMILALAGRYEAYSLGGDITLGKVREISGLGQKHGFVLAGLRSFGKEVTALQLEWARQAVLMRRKNAYEHLPAINSHIAT